MRGSRTFVSLIRLHSIALGFVTADTALYPLHGTNRPLGILVHGIVVKELRGCRRRLGPAQISARQTTQFAGKPLTRDPRHRRIKLLPTAINSFVFNAQLVDVSHSAWRRHSSNIEHWRGGTGRVWVWMQTITRTRHQGIKSPILSTYCIPISPLLLINRRACVPSTTTNCNKRSIVPSVPWKEGQTRILLIYKPRR